jgi:superfamily II DNA/RNA helicase
LIFTTFVGGEQTDDFVPGEKRHGTAATLKRTLIAQIKEVIPSFKKRERKRIAQELLAVLRREKEALDDSEYRSLERHLRNFGGSRCGCYMLSFGPNLTREKKHLRKQLRLLGQTFASDDPEEKRRAEDRRLRRLDALLHRYTTRDVVARYDGASDHNTRDRHLRGFNSPYAPLVLIASSVGQEGIDLQRYCSHVVHYDLEWNPAKLEQREGRVDRQGREAAGPVNVYFLICKDTYDERVLHVMINRMRWHQVLLPNRRALHGDISSTQEARFDQKWFRRVALDLRPRT